MKVSRVSEMRALDREAVEKHGISEDILMENAGLAAYRVLSRELPARGRRFAVICGTGNNGGDGFVVARKIISDGGSARVYVLGGRDRFTGAAKRNLDILLNMPAEIEEVRSVLSIRMGVLHCDAVIDALFGTGLARKVEGVYREAIDLINECRGPVFSLDIPSGVNGDTGEVMGAAVKADFTITFGLPKVGNLLYPGCEHCGTLFVSHISFPPALSCARHLKIETNDPVELPPRTAWGHKGDFGEALFIAGAAGYLGAPYFAAQSFLKAGGGYSRLAAPTSITPFLGSKGSEIVFHPQKETRAGSLSLKNKAELLRLAEKVDIVILGPGLSLEAETQRLVRELIRGIRKPLVIDGDGLTAVAGDLKTLRGRKAETILTPHPGEMARITGMSAAAMKGKALEILQKTSKELNATIVLKGAHSLVGYPDGGVFINLTGNAGMATAGSGDVLAGTIAAMSGLGLPLRDAVRMGVLVHGLSGDFAAREKGEDGITAQDILDGLPLTMKTLREGTSDPLWQKIGMV
ncbi:MAG TPA: NAD(P)H-hydrate dehydratase [Syntrophales bacterium]|nr:NAD(P)H-hydrate dehydratase [Syntrophales bacterium]